MHNKILRSHRGNSAEQIHGAKIIIHLSCIGSKRFKTTHLIVFLSSGQVRDAIKATCSTQNIRGKKKNSLNLQSGWIASGGRHGGLLVYGISYSLTSQCVKAKIPGSGPLSEQVKLRLTTQPHCPICDLFSYIRKDPPSL